MTVSREVRSRPECNSGGAEAPTRTLCGNCIHVYAHDDGRVLSGKNLSDSGIVELALLAG